MKISAQDVSHDKHTGQWGPNERKTNVFFKILGVQISWEYSWFLSARPSIALRHTGHKGERIIRNFVSILNFSSRRSWTNRETRKPNIMEHFKSTYKGPPELHDWLSCLCRSLVILIIRLVPGWFEPRTRETCSCHRVPLRPNRTFWHFTRWLLSHSERLCTHCTGCQPHRGVSIGSKKSHER